MSLFHQMLFRSQYANTFFINMFYYISQTKQKFFNVKFMSGFFAKDLNHKR